MIGNFSISNVSSSEGSSSTKWISLIVEGSFDELLEEDLISDRNLILELFSQERKCSCGSKDTSRTQL